MPEGSSPLRGPVDTCRKCGVLLVKLQASFAALKLWRKQIVDVKFLYDAYQKSVEKTRLLQSEVAEQQAERQDLRRDLARVRQEKFAYIEEIELLKRHLSPHIRTLNVYTQTSSDIDALNDEAAPPVSDHAGSPPFSVVHDERPVSFDFSSTSSNISTTEKIIVESPRKCRKRKKKRMEISTQHDEPLSDTIFTAAVSGPDLATPTNVSEIDVDLLGELFGPNNAVLVAGESLRKAVKKVAPRVRAVRPKKELNSDRAAHKIEGSTFTPNSPHDLDENEHILAFFRIGRAISPLSDEEVCTSTTSSRENDTDYLLDFDIEAMLKAIQSEFPAEILRSVSPLPDD